MGLIIRNLVELSNLKINDQVIAMGADFSMKSAAHAYLTATLTATTPEVRRLFSDLLGQKLNAHNSLTELIVKNKWSQPYDSLATQLSNIKEQSNWVTNVDSD